MGLSRREFLRMAAGLAIGAGTAPLANDLARQIRIKTEEATGLTADSAGVRKQLEQRPKLSSDDKRQIVITGPIAEEGVYRAIPAAFASNDFVDNPGQEIFTGAENLRPFSRREIIFALVTAAFFGVSHNFYSDPENERVGFDTKTIPAPQTAFGVFYWYLQRKFGMPANTIAHMLNNYISVQKYEKQQSSKN